MKRLVDLVVATALLILAVPIIALLAVGVWLNLGWPILFCQMRPGLQGRPFILYKFRTMRAGSKDRSDVASDAQRLTRYGRWLRAMSLDELPELWNVVRGDMSLVGPRPLLMQYLPLYSPEQMRRHEVRPGLTGWAQINGRNALSWEEKFKLDLWYIDNQSLLLDFKILLFTAVAVAKREGVSHADAATMPEFRGSSVEHH